MWCFIRTSKKFSRIFIQTQVKKSQSFGSTFIKGGLNIIKLYDFI